MKSHFPIGRERPDSFPVTELPERYGVNKPLIYHRLRALGIKSEKCGTKGYITLDQLEQLDALHNYTQQGSTTLSEERLDSFPVMKLPKRYGVTKTVIYRRLEALGIKPERWGGKAYITIGQLLQLDALHAHIRKGGATNKFIASCRDPNNPKYHLES